MKTNPSVPKLVNDELIEEFRWKDIIVRQRHDVFKIGTDALLLGPWIPRIIKSPVHILDAGTGTGILALMMGLFFPDATIVGFDQEEAAVQLANYNIQSSLWSDRIMIRRENILENVISEKEEYDLIICNPPFFFDQLAAQSSVNNKSKHADASATVWFYSLVRRLNSPGDVCIIVPFQKASEWIRAANENALYCHHRLDIYSFRDDMEPKRTLLHFRMNLIKPEISRLDVYEKENMYTRAYMEFCGIELRNRVTASLQFK